MTKLTAVTLMARQREILDLMIGAALDATGGDFGCMDEVTIPAGLKKHAFGAYVTQLQTLGLVEVHDEYNVNGERGNRVQQYTITDLGWVMGNYDPKTRQPLTTKRPISVAVETPSGKETTMANSHASKAQAEIDKLIRKLVALKDKSDSEGRKIRRMLRKLGHKGGTGKGPGRPAKAKPSKKAQAKRLQKTMPAKKAAAKLVEPPAGLTPSQAEADFER